MPKDLKYWVGINTCTEIGPARFKRLMAYFPSMRDAWQASTSELKEAGLEEKVVESLKKTVLKVNPDEEMKKLKDERVGVVTIKDKNYPENLKDIPGPPAILYIKGRIKKEDELALGIVGTRRMSTYGRQVTQDLSSKLAKSGVTVISGLAQGVDSVAHESALEAGGRTLGILAGGLDDASIYPPSNIDLARRIEAGRGALISEYHLGTPCLKHHFPSRNRLISAFSLGVLVTECPEHSGALLTARAALEQGRDVFAVPGDVRQALCRGPNNLIKIGAKPITDAEDLLEELNVESIEGAIEARKIIPENKEEKVILRVISNKPISLDKIIKKSGLKPSVASSTLTMMEIQGKLQNVGMNQYIIRK